MLIKKIAVGFLLLLSVYICIRPLFSEGFFPMHDDAQVARVVVMKEALQNGQFPVRLVSGLGYGYGYPLFNYYGPLPYYVGAFFSLLGMSGLDATKCMMGIGMLLCCIGMYFLGKEAFGMYGGVLSGVLYLFLPYRAVQLYVRGAVGELWASAFLPFILLGVLFLMKKQWLRGVTVGGIAFAFLVLSHTVFGYIVGGILLFSMLCSFVLFLYKKIDKHITLGFVALFLLGFGLSAFFTLPAFFEMGFTNVFSVIGKTADYHDHFVCFSQLWDSPWGFGGSSSGCMDGMSFKLGKIHILFFIAAILFFFYKKYRKERVLNLIMGICIIGSVLTIMMMLPISVFAWEHISFSSFVQYPWRLLAFAGFFISLGSGFLLYKQKGIRAVLLLGGALGVIFFVNAKLFVPQYLYEKSSSGFETEEDLRFRASRVSDEYLPKGIFKPELPKEALFSRVPPSDTLSVVKHSENETFGVYTLTSTSPGIVRLNMAFYPGWHFFINGKEVAPDVVDGMPSVVLSGGLSEVRMQFTDTPIRTIGNMISLVSILVLCFVYGKKAFSHYRHTGI